VRIVNDAFSQDSHFANEWNANTGTETSVRDVVNPFNILLEAMITSVLLIKHLIMEDEIESK